MTCLECPLIREKSQKSEEAAFEDTVAGNWPKLSNPLIQESEIYKQKNKRKSTCRLITYKLQETKEKGKNFKSSQRIKTAFLQRNYN